MQEGESEAEADERMYRLGKEHIARLKAEGHKCCDIPELFCYSCHALLKRIIFDLFLENRNGS